MCQNSGDGLLAEIDFRPNRISILDRERNLITNCNMAGEHERQADFSAIREHAIDPILPARDIEDPFPTIVTALQ
jgi:hypothetical protein